MAPGTTAKASAAMLTRVSTPANSAKKSRLAELAVLGAVCFAAVGHLLIKGGLNAPAATAAHVALWQRLLGYVLQPAVVLGLSIYAVGTAMWVFAVSKREISYLFPLSALNYVVVALGGKMLFGEAIPSGRWLGIAVVVAGVALMNWLGREES